VLGSREIILTIILIDDIICFTKTCI